MSTERARQTLAAIDVPTAADAKDQIRRARHKEADAERDRLLRIMRKNPGCTRPQLAEIAGVKEGKIHRILGSDDHALVQENQKTVTFSDEDIKEALLRGAELAGEPLTSAGYDSVKDQFEGPSSARVIQRFSTWTMACESAGVAHGRPRRAEYKRRWSDAEMLDWVAAYFATEGCRGTYKDFTTWAARTPGAPSAQTVRNRLGSWTIVKRAALALSNTSASTGWKDERDRH